MAEICVVGLWHQGVVLSACLADAGHTVWGVGEESVVAELSRCHPPVREPGLPAIIRRGLRDGRLHYTSDLGTGLKDAEFVFIAFDTPIDNNDRPDVSIVLSTADEIGRSATDGSKRILIVSSQVPVGTCDAIESLVKASNPAFVVAYVPEFLRLGSAVRTFRKADRFVIGAANPTVADRIAELYRPFRRPIVKTSVRVAEMAKHASNSFLAMSISFINEIADLCEEAGIDAVAVADIMKLDPRIGGQAFLSPGLGFAGGTLGRDVRALQTLGRATGRRTALLDAVTRVNRERRRWALTRLEAMYPNLQSVRVGVFGLTYKPGTSTLRRSTGLAIVEDLIERGAEIRVFDPLARLDEVTTIPAFELCTDPYETAERADALVLVTEWAGVNDLDLRRLRRAMRRPVFLDCRNIFDPEHMGELGFLYQGPGRGSRSCD